MCVCVPHRARAVLAAICPALILPVDDPLDAASSLTIAAVQTIHLFLCPGQLFTKSQPHPKNRPKKRKYSSQLQSVYFFTCRKWSFQLCLHKARSLDSINTFHTSLHQKRKHYKLRNSVKWIFYALCAIYLFNLQV